MLHLDGAELHVRPRLSRSNGGSGVAGHGFANPATLLCPKSKRQHDTAAASANEISPLVGAPFAAVCSLAVGPAMLKGGVLFLEAIQNLAEALQP